MGIDYEFLALERVASSRNGLGAASSDTGRVGNSLYIIKGTNYRAES